MNPLTLARAHSSPTIECKYQIHHSLRVPVWKFYRKTPEGRSHYLGFTAKEEEVPKRFAKYNTT